MATDSEYIDPKRKSTGEYIDLKQKKHGGILKTPNDEIDKLNEYSGLPEYLELVDMQNYHQYEQVKYSMIEENENKSKVNLKAIRQFFSVVLVVVIIVAVVLLCVIFGLYILNMTSENTDLSKLSSPNNKSDEKREFVKQMMLDSWNAYVRLAWGQEGVCPVSKRPWNGRLMPNSGFTIVTSMSTLWTMGLKEEFKRGKTWIETELDLSKMNRDVDVFYLIVNYIGGLLSCYALTNDRLFLNKALTIAQLIEPAFNTSKGLPYKYFNLKEGKATSIDYSWEFNLYLSHVGGFQLDFNYLSDASEKQKYRTQLDKIQKILKESGKPKNLYFEKIDFEGNWKSSQNDLFKWSREFYISLVKSFIQSNHSDIQSIEMYKEALDALDSVMMFKVSSGGLYYAQVYDNSSKSLENHMYYSGCYLGAMLSLGAKAMQRELKLNSSIGNKDKVIDQNRINRHWHLAEQITETCQQASVRTKTGLGPDHFYFEGTHDIVPYYPYYHLSPELAESNFILWRLTHNQKYRDNAWQMAQAIHRHCRVKGGGYSEIKNVDQVPATKTDYQSDIIFSATFKYLYLTFTDDSVLSLDEWIFNSVGHPLPICGITFNCHGTIFPNPFVSSHQGRAKREV